MKRLIIAMFVIALVAVVFIVTCRFSDTVKKPTPAIELQGIEGNETVTFVQTAVRVFQTQKESEFMKLWAEVPPEQYAAALQCLKRGKGDFKVERVMQQQDSKDLFYVDGKLNTATLEFIIRKTDEGLKIENVYEIK